MARGPYQDGRTCNMKTGEAIKIGMRSLWNRTIGYPICVSFEVTHSCVANCVHCDKGGVKPARS